MNSNPLRDNVFSQLADPFSGEALFDRVPDLVYFVKNSQGQYVVANESLVLRCGVAGKQEIIGRTAEELFPAPLGRGFLAQDLALLESGEPLLDQLELHIYPTSGPGWCLTTKLPLLGRQGQTVGLVGISKDLQAPTLQHVDYQPMAAAIDHAKNHLDDALTSEQLARVAGLSVYQLDQRVRQVFHMTASQLVLKLRIDEAARRLTNTGHAIAQIALEVGYSDQSAFARQFRKTTGLSPSEFRQTQRTLPNSNS